MPKKKEEAKKAKPVEAKKPATNAIGEEILDDEVLIDDKE